MDSDDHLRSLSELLSAACHGTLTAAQAEELDSRLSVDADARRAYLDRMHVEASLHRLLRAKSSKSAMGDTHSLLQAIHAVLDDAPSSAPAESEMPRRSMNDAMILPAMKDVDEEPMAAPPGPRPWVLLPRPQHAGPPRASVAKRMRLPVAAAFVMAALLTFALESRRAVSPATLAGAIDVRWNAAAAIPPIGEHLPAGMLALDSGLVHLTFPHHVSVVIQGPAEFQIHSASRLFLRTGILTAHVPHAGVGFAVTTPQATVTDLGTEFGVSVDRDQQTHAEVFVGKVTAARADAADDARLIESGKAVEIAGHGRIEFAAPRPMTFVRPSQFTDMQHAAGDPAFTHWRAFSNQLQTDPSLLAYYAFDPATSITQLVAGGTAARADGTIAGATWDHGRFAGKSALRFNGRDSHVEVHIPGRFDALTLAAWINVPIADHEFNGLFCDDVRKQSVFHWYYVHQPHHAPLLQLGVKHAADDGWSNYDFPAPELELHPKEWHLVAIGYDLRARLVRCWIDGRSLGSQPIAAPQQLEMNTAQIGNWKSTQKGLVRGLNGRMDELAIWSRPLADQEIQAMYQAGRPPS